MVCLDLDHPEIQDFVWWKVREEEKVAGLVTGSKKLKTRLGKLIDLAKGKENPLEDTGVQKAIRAAAQDGIPVNYIVRSLDLARQGHTLPLEEFDTHYESEAYLTVSALYVSLTHSSPQWRMEQIGNSRDEQMEQSLGLFLRNNYGMTLGIVHGHLLTQESSLIR